MSDLSEVIFSGLGFEIPYCARNQDSWRKRVGVEPTGDGVTRRPPVLKTGTITGPHALPKKLLG